MNRRLIMLAPVLLLMTGCTVVELNWGTDFEAARRQAGETGRPILADFTGSDWCGWCMKLKKEVFTKPVFQEYARDNLVLLKLDFPQRLPQSEAVRKQNEMLMAHYRVETFPTILLLDAEGRELGRTGYQPGGAKIFVAQLKLLLKDVPPPVKPVKPAP